MLRVCVLSVVFLLPGRLGVAATYGFDEAVRRGVVDFVVNPYAQVSYDAILSGLKSVNPGLVNRLGFKFGGATLRQLDAAGAMARRVRLELPDARLGGGFPESLRRGYSEALPCDTEVDVRTFTRAELTSVNDAKGWVDPSLAAAQAYYVCIGKAQLRRGFAHLHFEASDSVLKQARDRPGAIAGLRRVRETLLQYGRAQGMEPSFSGEPDLARELPLDAVYLPARVFTDTFAREYRNRVTTQEGRGYTYLLSPAIAAHYLALVPRRTRVLFYIDNYDGKQDDLRRLMELDGPNRRAMITGSAAVARDHGVVFVPSLDHCDGCVAPDLVGDPCELLPGRHISYYDAATCGDLDAVRRALLLQRPTR